ncbi:MAG: hypothetical protein FJ202_09250 [Gemmatimonadetes bacterium]|nr:hypothetical protein [Gemmatimonadota bacterium]
MPPATFDGIVSAGQAGTSASVPAAGAPAAQTGAQSGAPVATTVAAPSTALEIRVLRARRSEISSQLGNITSRREDHARALRDATPGADRAGIEARIQILDQRILELENDLNVTGRALASARGEAATIVDPPAPPGQAPRFNSGQMTAMTIVFFVAVLMPLVITLGHVLRRKASRAINPGVSPEVTGRLDRLEQGLDAVAIEVERVSESQRYLSKTLMAGHSSVPQPMVADLEAVPRGAPIALDAALPADSRRP